MGITKKQRNHMRDYLISKLEASASRVEPVIVEIAPGIKTNYISVGDEEKILLIDRVYPKKTMNHVYRVLQSEGRVTPIFYKDGETFFRNAIKKNYFKKNKHLSLKNYSNQEMHRMILFRPEESFVSSIRDWLQYFQPVSERLSEGVESFKFEPVEFNYDHIGSDRFQPENRDSEKLRIWIDRRHREENLEIYKNYLVGKVS